jgi:tetratricopeptide (TPR) repeat protein
MTRVWRASLAYGAWGVGIGASLIAAGIALMNGWGLMLAVLGAAVIAGVARTQLPAWLLHARWKRLSIACELEDLRRARALVEKIAAMRLAPQAHWACLIMRASLASFEERYREARDILEAIESKDLVLLLRINRDNGLAWAMAHDGAAAEAIPIAERAVAALTPKMPASFASSCIGTRGVAELEAGRLGEARETLERALAVGGGPRLIASGAFYLGETLVALGHLDEAAEAYEKASRAMPEGRYGLKARAAFASIAAKQPYRG